VAYGAKSPDNLQQGSRALAEVLSNAELRELEHQSHNISMKTLAPILAHHFADAKSPLAPHREETRAAA
jgi:hypothetical protein